MKIKLDLNDLTPKLAAEADGRGNCLYTTPCIIGTLMTQEQRKYCDSLGVKFGTDVQYLVDNDIITFADPKQLTDAIALQTAFDAPLSSDFDDVLSSFFKRKENAAA